jgi:preprotein translocase subunit SecY
MASAAEQLAANMNFSAFSKATDLHKRIWFTLIAMVVYRLGCYIPIPGINAAEFARQFESQQAGLLGMFNMFSGGAVQNMAIFSLNVMPYISASIIVQLLGTVYPPWEKLKKEGGEAGRKQLNQYTRYLTVVLALFQAGGIALGLQNSQGLVGHPGLPFVLSTVATLVGGTLFLMWLGEQVTARGVGNGVSLIIFAGIVARLPVAVYQLFTMAQAGKLNGFTLILMLAGATGLIAFIVFMERSQRRLVIQYPKGQGAQGMVGREQSFLPLKINTSGVIPPIFASSLLFLPQTIVGFLAKGNLPDWADWLPTLAGQLGHGKPAYIVMYGLLIVFFCFFYTSVVFNPQDTAENLRKYGGFIPGIRPGAKTAEYLEYVLTRLTVIGAAYITLVCLLPEALMANGTVSSFYFGGTSILIVVSVTMDTVSQIQSHLLAHQYEGLIKKSRLRGGRGRGQS